MINLPSIFTSRLVFDHKFEIYDDNSSFLRFARKTLSKPLCRARSAFEYNKSESVPSVIYLFETLLIHLSIMGAFDGAIKEAFEQLRDRQKPHSIFFSRSIFSFHWQKRCQDAYAMHRLNITKSIN